ncbi:MAG: NAD(P)/FAD-dependent oxidoreductase [Candidatus Methylomirabilia bacterium]
MNYLIAGGGIAALSAIRAIRARDPAGSVTVVSAEDPGFYFRPMTPLVVRGEREAGELLQGPDALAGVNVICGRVASLDTVRRLVGVEGRESLAYDRLLIATGSSPCVPDIPGVNERNVHYLRTLEDAVALRRAAAHGGAVVILGGGFVGIKLATALAHRGLRVTVVEKESQILLPRLDAAGAQIVSSALEARGVTLLVRETITEILPGARGVRLASGRTLACDFVCIAVGVRPNVDWLTGSGVTVDRAVVVDEGLRTTVAEVCAAGDVVQTLDQVSGKVVVSALWTNAVQMGRVAGITMTGGKGVYPDGLEVFNASEIEGLPLISVGEVLAESGGGREVHRQRRGPAYRKLVFADNVLTGAIFIGDVRHAGVYAALISSRRPLGRLKAKAVAGTLTYADTALALNKTS